MSVKSICGVILASERPAVLAEFYAAALDLEFEREDHGDLELHYGVDIGEVHFGIHPPGNLGLSKAGHSATSIAFNVGALEAIAERLVRLGAEVVREPHDEGFGRVASWRDPDGNLFEIVELDYEFNKA